MGKGKYFLGRLQILQDFLESNIIDSERLIISILSFPGILVRFCRTYRQLIGRPHYASTWLLILLSMFNARVKLSSVHMCLKGSIFSTVSLWGSIQQKIRVGVARFDPGLQKEGMQGGGEGVRHCGFLKPTAATTPCLHKGNPGITDIFTKQQARYKQTKRNRICWAGASPPP